VLCLMFVQSRWKGVGQDNSLPSGLGQTGIENRGVSELAAHTPKGGRGRLYSVGRQRRDGRAKEGAGVARPTDLAARFYEREGTQ